MSTPEEAMYEEALSAVYAGDRARARDLFTRLLKIRQDNPDYWIWMSAVVDTTKERSFCLKEALRVDPENVAAKRGLALLGVVPPDPANVVPAHQQKRNWQSRLAFPEDPELAAAKATTRPQFVMMGAAAVVVIGLIAFAIFGMQNQLRKRNTRPIIVNLPTNTAVLAEAVTPTQPVAEGTALPLIAQLKETYTPTPLYVNTPHTINEAYRVGLRNFQRGEWDKAITYFSQVLQTEPNAADIIFYLGESYRQQGNLTQALQVYNDGLQKNAQFAPLYVGRARVRLAQNPKSMDEVERDLKDAVRIDANYGEAYLALSEMYARSGRMTQALSALEEAEQFLPNSPLVWLYRAEAYLAGNEPQKALESARKANALDITMLDAYRVMGEALQAQGNMKASLEPLTIYLRYATADARGLFLLANAQLAGGDPKGARRSLDQALRMDSRHPKGFIQRGRLLLDENQASEALDDFRKALSLDADSFDASLGVAKALMALKYPGDAYNQIEKSKGLAVSEPQKAEWRFWRAQSLDVLGEKVIAARDYQALLEFPKGVADEAWVAYAQKRISILITSTPTVRPRTSTPTLTLTNTRQPTRTFTPTNTRQPTRTNTATATPAPTRTHTSTATPVPTKTQTSTATKTPTRTPTPTSKP